MIISVVEVSMSDIQMTCGVYMNYYLVICLTKSFQVKHMHWYGLEDKVSVCECRCSRARLPPSK